MGVPAKDWEKALRALRDCYRVYAAVSLSRGRRERTLARIAEAGKIVKAAQAGGEGEHAVVEIG